MATQTDANKALSTTENTGLQELIEKSSKELSRALPSHLKPERLVRIALTCIRLNPELGKCTPASFLGALFTSAQLGVEPIAGRAYILPFNNKRKKPDNTWHTLKEAQFIMGYRGLVDLFYRHEKSVKLAWGVRKEKDNFQIELGTNAYLKHIPFDGERGKTIGYYVIAELQNGGKMFHYMTELECIEHGMKHSKTYDRKTNNFYEQSPWFKDPESMCLKTVLIQLSKLLPLSIELQSAIQADETSRDYRPGVDNALDLPSVTNWDKEEVKQIEETKKEAEQSFDGIEP
jgi:recombination protein RecT